MRRIDTTLITPTPWRNGIGTTRELACHPVGASMDNFDWRLSIAEVSEDRPFSRYPGIDRVIALLHGHGLRLNMTDGASHSLTDPMAPFAFAGETNIYACLVDGTTLDFNLMYRRDKFDGSVTIHTAPCEIDAAQHALAVMVVKGMWSVTDRHNLRHDLVSGQALLAEKNHPALSLQPCKEGSTLLCATIRPRQE